MKKNSAFLNSSQLSTIHQPNRYFERSGSEVTSTGETLSLKSKVEKKIISICNQNIKQSKNQLCLITVEIGEYDGTSWLMQRLFESLKSDYGTFNFFNVTRIADDYQTVPKIAQIIGKKRFYQYAVKNKVLEGFPSLFPIPYYLLFALSIVLSVLTHVLLPFLKTSSSLEIDNILTSQNALLVFVITAILIVSKLLTEKIIFRPKSKLFSNLNEKLKNIETHIQGSNELDKSTLDFSSIYNKFISDIINYLHNRDYPRFFLVDNFSRIDFTSKRIIEQYFEKFIGEELLLDGKEIWIVTEPRFGNEKLSTHLLLDQKNLIDKIIKQIVVDPFSITEKKELVKEINGDPSWEKFSEAQFICHGKGKAHNWIYEKCKTIRDSHQYSEAYNHLDLAFLLSLTTYFDHHYFTKKEVQEILSNKKSKTAFNFILSKVLRDGNLSKAELGQNYKTLLAEFEDLLIFDENNGISLVNDFSYTLLQYRNELNLPKSYNGHLIWAIHWGSTLINNPYDRDSIKKLTHHIVNSGFKEIPNDNLNDTLTEIFEYSLYAIHGCIYTGYFDFIVELLDRSKDLLFLMESPDGEKKLELLHVSWKAYSLLKDNNIINVFIELSEKIDFDGDTQLDLLTELSVELIPFPFLSKSLKHQDFGIWILNQKNNLSLEFYLKSQAVWVSLSAHPLTMDLDMTLLSKSGIDAYSSHKTVSKVLINTKWKKSDLIITMVSLSTISWSKALLFQDEIIPTRPNNLTSYYEDFLDVLTHSADTLSFLRYNGLITEKNTFLDCGAFLKAMVGDILLSNLSSIYVAYLSIVKNPFQIEFEDKDSKLKDLATENIRAISHLLELKLDNISELEHIASANVRNRIIDLFSFYSLIWMKLNMRELYNCVTLKRIQFFTLTTSNRGVESIDDKLISTINEFLDHRNQTGILSNLVISKYLERLTQHSSYYFNNAGNLAIEGDFGNKIVKELSALILVYFNSLNVDLSHFAEQITHIKGTGTSYLFDILSTLPERKLFNIILKLSNSTNSILDHKISKNYRNTLRGYNRRILNPSIKRKTSALFEYIDLSENLKKSKIDPSQVLDHWGNRKDLYLYAAVLTMLLNKSEVNQRTKSEVLEVLSNPMDSSYNSYLHLAVIYSERYLLSGQQITQEEERIVIGYLLQNCNRFEDIEDADMNYRVFRALNYFYHPEFNDKLYSWEKILRDIEHKEAIPALLKKGHYYLLFRKYVEDMWLRGLRVDINRRSYWEQIHIKEENKADELKRWLSANSRIPEPIISGEIINSEYLIIGSYLFSHSTIENSRYETLRNDFNKIGKLSILNLVDIILDSEKIPSFIKDILADFYSKIQNYDTLAHV